MNKHECFVCGSARRQLRRRRFAVLGHRVRALICRSCFLLLDEK